MTRIATQFPVPAALTAAAALLVTLALAGPAPATTGDLAHAATAGTRSVQVMVVQATSPATPSQPPAPVPAAKASRSKADPVEARITMLHVKLAIIPAQEDL